jgi:DNA-binding MarR family transcriptional regulator
LTPAGIELAERALPLITDDYARQFGKGLNLQQREQLSSLLKLALSKLEPVPDRRSGQ